MEFTEVFANETEQIRDMSETATAIVREYYDPIIGKEQNDYMLAMFQTAEAITKQLNSGYRYFFVRNAGRTCGFLAFYPRGNAMYLSKLYLYRTERGKGYARDMIGFVAEEAKKCGLNAIELNVNKNNPTCRIYERLGFTVLRAEKNDIGNGFYMDDYVYRLEFSS